MIDLRLPNINADTTEEQVGQMRSYIYQMVQELNWAFNSIEKAQSGDTSSVVVEGGTTEAESKKAKETFNSIKDLIIKSADIVDAYYDSLTERYDGHYVAQSDFGTYQKDTNQTITETSESITRAFESIQTIEETIKESQGYIKQGILGTDDDGGEIVGVEVGQTVTEGEAETFNRFARFTAEGIYFYLPGIDYPIAYMSNQKLYITHAEVNNSMKLGGYKVDLKNGIAFKWEG